MAVGLLLNLTASEVQPEPAVTLFLLGDILNRFNSTDSEKQQQLVEVTSKSLSKYHDFHCFKTLKSFLEIGEDLIAEGTPSVANIEVCQWEVTLDLLFKGL